MADRLPVAVESTAKRAFAWAVDWPGWCRGARTELLALEALAAAASRYAEVAGAAGLRFDPSVAERLDVVERVPGSSGTDFGVPGQVTPTDGTPVDATEADRLARLVEAAWAIFDQVAAAAPAELRKGPRGGGRDTAKVVDHVNGADHAYAGVMGIKLPAPADADQVLTMRRAMLEALRRPSDGSPIADRKWPPRYAARRIAWHALDHAWEIEDRSRPAS
jgi:hypothetical protein